MTDKVTMTFLHNPKSEEGRSAIIDALIGMFEDLKVMRYDVDDLVIGSHPYTDDDEI